MAKAKGGNGNGGSKMPMQPGEGMTKSMPGPMHGMTTEKMPSTEEMNKMRGGMGKGVGGKGKR